MGSFDTDTKLALLCLALGYPCMGAGAVASMAHDRAFTLFGLIASASLICAALAIGARRWIRESKDDKHRLDILARAALDGSLESLVRALGHFGHESAGDWRQGVG
jgi:hypothetical protein